MNWIPGMKHVVSAFFWTLILTFPAVNAISQIHQGENLKMNIIRIQPGDTPAEILEKASHIVPSQRQFEWQEMEFIAFTHFGMNTFSNREWGEGTDAPALFNPDDFDADQWARVIHDAGMKMIILTARHHDGFCLWPSRWTDYSVLKSNWRNGKGDVVKEVSDACHKYGLKFGIYLSPWDRHEPFYGNSPRYNEFFRNQLRELLTNYGKISEVWFDGACGEGANGKKQVYDWPSYYHVIRDLQPDAVIAIMGPDVRWVGTESGTGRETEWSVLPDVVGNTDSIAASSQQIPMDSAFIPRNFMDQDLGGRDKIMKANNLFWYPAETDVSIRPGWFYHPEEDSLVKSPERLVDIYFSSVGMNSVLLLNIPPNKHGRIQDQDVKSLAGMRKILDETFRNDLVLAAGSRSSKNAYEYSLGFPQRFNVALLQEEITQGQRIEKFRIEYLDGKEWKVCASGTTVGYKRLLRFKEVSATEIRLVIESSRGTAIIKSFGVYHMEMKNQE
jgi:alpha-L-fucosidase